MENTLLTNVKFYGLLYVSMKAQDGAYLQRLDPRKRVELYLRMAVRLGRGLYSRFGLPLNLVTNDAETLTALLAGIEGGRHADCVRLVQIDFSSLSLPQGARYFAATHKVMLFDYFAKQSEYSALLDIDMICLPGAEQPLGDFVRDKCALVYDISDQVFPAHGYDRILADMRKFGPVDRRIRWYGGEFIAGSPDFFRELSQLAMQALPIYGDVFQSLHHQGDEMITSYCLNYMRQNSSPNMPLDVGGGDIVRRHHGKATLHDERRFGRIANLSFLHLPTVKSLLSSRLSDAFIVKLLLAMELLPRRLAGLSLAALGTLV